MTMPGICVFGWSGIRRCLVLSGVQKVVQLCALYQSILSVLFLCYEVISYFLKVYYFCWLSWAFLCQIHARFLRMRACVDQW